MHQDWTVCPICGDDPSPDCTLCDGAGILDYWADDVDAGEKVYPCPECGRRMEVRHRGNALGRPPALYCDHCAHLEPLVE